jgi:drug/metabolite transporter, DME family
VKPTDPSLAHGRLCVVLAAVFWSLSGALTRLLTDDTPLRLGVEPVHGLTIAFYRPLFAALVLLPTLRRADLAFRPGMILMAALFAVMNAAFILAMAWGKSSNAILLQYTAPLWMYLATIWLLGEKADRRSSVAVVVGLVGVAVILLGGTQEVEPQGAVIVVGLVSGVTYAGVMVCLRGLRDLASRWLTVFNHLVAAVVLVPVLCWFTWQPGFGPYGWQSLTVAQVLVLFFYGSVQMGLPYWLVARGLRVVSPQEAGTITLLEPLLNPVWAFLVAPGRETPSAWTLAGGAVILGALAYRYWPRRQRQGDRNG